MRVGALLKAEVGAGPGPISRSHDDAIRALDPDTAARWRSRDHGMTHLTCTYRMTMNGSLYTYAHIAKQALTNGEPLDPATCRTQATRQEAVRRMREFTEGCSDPHAGAYWGFDLTLDP